jgi:hypothetical protein
MRITGSDIHRIIEEERRFQAAAHRRRDEMLRIKGRDLRRLVRETLIREAAFPEEIEGIYVLKQVTNESVRTGNMHAQTRYDTIGQRADAQLIADDMPIYKYPVIGARFERFDGRPR